MKVSLLLLLFPGVLLAENWPCWRGPRMDGTSAETNVPVHWSATSNLIWKTELPGSGHASPIVWEDKIFTVSAIAEQEARVLLCVNRADGKLLWQKTVVVAPFEGKHRLNSHASSTPATDGEFVYVAFLDRKEMLVAAYDFSGNQKWLVRPGPFSSMHGFCSSPLLFKDKIIVNGDHDGDSYIVALDRATGKTVWKMPRKNRTRSYCVPLIRELDGKTQMVLSGDKSIASYDPNNGKLHWLIDGPTEQFVASPVYNATAGLLFITGGYPDHHILALKPDGKIMWRTTRGVSYVPSPIAAGDFFFVVSDSGVAHCFEAATGKIIWTERMGEHHASLVAANGLVYFLNDEGVMNVVRASREFIPVAKNELGERTFASPAISNGQLFLRSDKHLFCILTR
ncbi:MAG TPA: PQQ-binding-like beta-propeller repeat protein [Verrucomicrobiae bacterium]|nr:PQQ-binding-like beta-propeller repeat protein [Verrucomicrobiae bacterium]